MRYTSDLSRALYKFGNIQINDYPFPHFYLEDVFDASYYSEMMTHLPTKKNMITLPDTGRVSKDAYKERFVYDLIKDSDVQRMPTEDQQEFWHNFRSIFASNEFISCMVDKFRPYFQLHPLLRQKQTPTHITPFMTLVRDEAGYGIGPHSDAQFRLLNILFYLPENNDNEHLGTSLYLPKDRQFKCAGGPHYKRGDFDEIGSAPFRKNSAICFFKTENSFHGVEKLEKIDDARTLLLYYLRID